MILSSQFLVNTQSFDTSSSDPQHGEFVDEQESWE
jgi:hypothetical protein